MIDDEVCSFAEVVVQLFRSVLILMSGYAKPDTACAFLRFIEKPSSCMTLASAVRKGPTPEAA